MAFDLPTRLRESLAALAAAPGGGTMRDRAAQLTAAYGKGKASSAIDVAAYLTARMPATYAAVSSVFHYVSETLPGFAPRSMADIGAGPGTASLAAQNFWPSLQGFELVEPDPRFATVAMELLRQANLNPVSLQDANTKAELVVAAYVLAELAQDEAASAALKLWQGASEALVVIEPGTPQGFARIRAVRAALLGAGAVVIGPCTHAKPCPMVEGDWCHFKVRLARARAHMHAKGASVPFEDEAYSWVAFSRNPVIHARARLVAPPRETKAAMELRLCSATGLTSETFASRDKATYKRLRKLKWGDSLNA